MPNKTITYLSIMAIAIGLIFLANGLILAVWSPPTAPPPDDNVPTPLNVGVDGQSKIGGLILNTGGAPIGLIVDQGNVGIGTTAPNSKLEVFHNGVADSSLARFYQSAYAGEDFTLVEIKGYWGNSTNNYTALDVRGNLDDANGTALLKLTHNNTAGISANNSAYIIQAFGDDEGEFDGISNDSDEMFSITTRGKTYFQGNVGIGTTNPGANLEVEGSPGTVRITYSGLGSCDIRVESGGIGDCTAGWVPLGTDNGRVLCMNCP